MTWYSPAIRIALSVLCVLVAVHPAPGKNHSEVSKLAEKAGVEPLRIKDIPAFRLITLEGDTIQYPGIEQRLLLLHFWATWCMPCRKEMPELDRLAARAKAQGLSLLVVGVSIDEGEKIKQVVPLVREMNLHFPIALASENDISEAFWTWGIPVTYIIQPGAGFAGRLRGTGRWLEGPLWQLVQKLAAGARRSSGKP
ncbi:MAG: TlpA family protein disulfide reductase [Calditrichaeota bacterium]|nr:MAG: TlpA family protein disulfide reductase [Calditrichota bacterium]